MSALSSGGHGRREFSAAPPHGRYGIFLSLSLSLARLRPRRDLAAAAIQRVSFVHGPVHHLAAAARLCALVQPNRTTARLYSTQPPVILPPPPSSSSR